MAVWTLMTSMVVSPLGWTAVMVTERPLLSSAVKWNLVASVVLVYSILVTLEMLMSWLTLVSTLLIISLI